VVRDLTAPLLVLPDDRDRAELTEPGHAAWDALSQADRWLAEGADSLTVQPVLIYVDVLTRSRAHTRVPLVTYSTSGEQAALAALTDAAVIEYHG
jgi:porphobilinogen synthase